MERLIPWYVGTQNDGLCIIDKPPSPSETDVVWEGRQDLHHIACVDSTSFEDKKANANLLAAAPELYHALCWIMKDHGGRGPGSMYCCDCKACELGRAAIRKAEGVS